MQWSLCPDGHLKKFWTYFFFLQTLESLMITITQCTVPNFELETWIHFVTWLFKIGKKTGPLRKMAFPSSGALPYNSALNISFISEQFFLDFFFLNFWIFVILKFLSTSSSNFSFLLLPDLCIIPERFARRGKNVAIGKGKSAQRPQFLGELCSSTKDILILFPGQVQWWTKIRIRLIGFHQ